VLASCVANPLTCEPDTGSTTLPKTRDVKGEQRGRMLALVMSYWCGCSSWCCQLVVAPFLVYNPQLMTMHSYGCIPSSADNNTCSSATTELVLCYNSSKSCNVKLRVGIMSIMCAIQSPSKITWLAISCRPLHPAATARQTHNSSGHAACCLQHQRSDGGGGRHPQLALQEHTALCRLGAM
jgi:hypothetical protein